MSHLTHPYRCYLSTNNYIIDNIDECDSSPCLNDGTCTDGLASYTCACRHGWTGPQCAFGTRTKVLGISFCGENFICRVSGLVVCFLIHCTLSAWWSTFVLTHAVHVYMVILHHEQHSQNNRLNMIIFLAGNVVESVVYKMVTILSRLECLKARCNDITLLFVNCFFNVCIKDWFIWERSHWSREHQTKLNGLLVMNDILKCVGNYIQIGKI